jgi:hypothetical protein
MISGFMIVKDLLKPGYPFVEAVASALPVCDEFLISDGYSTDGTFEVVQRMSELNKKIKVSRQKWPIAKRLTVLADVTNAIKAKCSYDYIFSVQANEIVHEDSAEFIKALPEMCPEVQTFSLPFLHLLSNYKFSEEFRLRFSRNLPSIVAVGDAWALGPSKAFVVSEAFKSLKSPRKFLRYIGRGVEWTYANSCGNVLSRAVYLPKPVFRYWSLFPRDYLEKCVKHAEMFNLPEFHETISTLRSHVDDDPSSFWRIAAELARKGPLGFKYPKGFRVVNNEDHPRVMLGLISDSHVKSYYVREEVLDLIRGL